MDELKTPAILLSIKPRFVADILNGKKTLEIRKTKPRCKLPIRVYIYCTKSKEYLLDMDSNGEWFIWNKNFPYYPSKYYNGKIVGYFTLKTIETIKPIDSAIDLTKNENKGIYWLVKESCLSFTEFVKYKGKYAWYIDNVVVYDNPRELKEFNRYELMQNCNKCPYKNNKEECLKHPSCEIIKPLTYAPRSYCYIG